jgi:TDG/mug DNA glycosylase family protein
MRTLPDRLRPGLDLVSIGINPSLFSAEKGFPFARPQNRFWKALARSGLAPAGLEPGVETIETLFLDRGIGFTDVVKRPTRAASELTDADWQRGARGLRRKLLRIRPRIAWFHGREAWTRYLRHAEGERTVFRWGKQDTQVAGAIVFVTPNPSGLNAGHSLEDLVRWYRRLARLRASSRTRPGR